MSVDLETLANASLPGDLPEREDDTDYRTLSGVAVAGFVAGLLSVLAFLAWSLAVIPFAGILLSCRALASIRRRPDELSGRKLACAGLILSLLFLVGGWAALTIEYLTEVPEGFLRVTYGMLQHADGESEDAIPAAATALEGQKVFLKGYIHPSVQGQAGIKEFVFVRDNGVCCFGTTTPKKTDMVLVKMADGLTVEYSTYLHKLAGTLHVKRVSYGAMGEVIYHLTAEYVR